MEKKRKKKASKEKKAINETELEEYPITLSLKCPSCNWEWSETIIFLPPSLSVQCPSCFHKPIYLIRLY
jgi:ribosomal protein S27E